MSKKLVYIALKEFLEILGVTRYLHSDKAKERTSAPHWWQVLKKQEGLHTTHIESHSMWKNSTKQGVGILKRVGAHLMRNTDATPVLWEWVLDYEAEG